MNAKNERYALVSFDVSNCYSGEAAIYGTPSGLEFIADSILDVASRQSSQLNISISEAGPLLSYGVNLRVCHSSVATSAAQVAIAKTSQMFRQRREFHGSLESDTVTSFEECELRADGAFVVAHPECGDLPELVFTGNGEGLTHIAKGLKWMAAIEYPPYDSKYPENSEHHHSYLDGEDDVMLPCGLSLLIGRLDHRRDGSISWITEKYQTWSKETRDFLRYAQASEQ